MAFFGCFNAGRRRAKAHGVHKSRKKEMALDVIVSDSENEDALGYTKGNCAYAIDGCSRSWSRSPLTPDIEAQIQAGFLHGPMYGALYHGRCDGWDNRTTGTTLSSFTLSTIFEDCPDDGIAGVDPPTPHTLASAGSATFSALPQRISATAAPVPSKAVPVTYQNLPNGPWNGLVGGGGLDASSSLAAGSLLAIETSHHNSLYFAPYDLSNPSGHDDAMTNGWPSSVGAAGGGGAVNGNGGTGCHIGSSGSSLGSVPFPGPSPSGLSGFGSNQVLNDQRMFTIISSSHLSTVLEEEATEGLCCASSCHSAGEGCCSGACCPKESGAATNLLRGLSAPDPLGFSSGGGTTDATAVATQYDTRRLQPSGPTKLAGGSLAVWYF